MQTAALTMKQMFQDIHKGFGFYAGFDILQESSIKCLPTMYLHSDQNVFCSLVTDLNVPPKIVTQQRDILRTAASSLIQINRQSKIIMPDEPRR